AFAWCGSSSLSPFSCSLRQARNRAEVSHDARRDPRSEGRTRTGMPARSLLKETAKGSARLRWATPPRRSTFRGTDSLRLTRRQREFAHVAPHPGPQCAYRSSALRVRPRSLHSSYRRRTSIPWLIDITLDLKL